MLLKFQHDPINRTFNMVTGTLGCQHCQVSVWLHILPGRANLNCCLLGKAWLPWLPAWQAWLLRFCRRPVFELSSGKCRPSSRRSQDISYLKNLLLHSASHVLWKMLIMAPALPVFDTILSCWEFFFRKEELQPKVEPSSKFRRAFSLSQRRTTNV